MIAKIPVCGDEDIESRGAGGQQFAIAKSGPAFLVTSANLIARQGPPQRLWVQTPFSYAARIAEAGLLCAKASRFSNQELRWNKATLSFPNHAEATKTIVCREYRKGFELPAFG